LQLEGVGTGALEAAQKAVGTDINELVSRFKLVAGQPAPYALLADTFEEIAETTKRLIITSTLVCVFPASCQFS
jgi:DNA ligase-1